MYTNGTATAGYLDLLDTVIDYVTTQLGAENWVVQRRIPPIMATFAVSTAVTTRACPTKGRQRFRS